MNLASIETFVAILDEGSLVGAATRLHVTQSTVTARLKTLEQELGQQLIYRSKSGATPTAAGQRFRRNAETMLDLWTQAQRDASLSHMVSDVITIGSHPDLWTEWTQRLVDLLHHHDADLAVSTRHGSAAELAEWQRSGLTDVSLTFTPSITAGQRAWAVQSEQLILVATDPDTPTSFDPGYVFVEAGEEFARRHAEAYATAAIARFTFDSSAAGLDHIRRHGGSAYLPERVAAQGLADGTLHRLHAGPTFERDRYVVARVDALDHWPWFGDALDLLSEKLRINQNQPVRSRSGPG